MSPHRSYRPVTSPRRVYFSNISWQSSHQEFNRILRERGHTAFQEIDWLLRSGGRLNGRFVGKAVIDFDTEVAAQRAVHDLEKRESPMVLNSQGEAGERAVRASVKPFTGRFKAVVYRPPSSVTVGMTPEPSAAVTVRSLIDGLEDDGVTLFTALGFKEVASSPDCGMYFGGLRPLSTEDAELNELLTMVNKFPPGQIGDHVLPAECVGSKGCCMITLTTAGTSARAVDELRSIMSPNSKLRLFVYAPKIAPEVAPAA